MGNIKSKLDDVTCTDKEKLKRILDAVFFQVRNCRTWRRVKTSKTIMVTLKHVQSDEDIMSFKEALQYAIKKKSL